MNIPIELLISLIGIFMVVAGLLLTRKRDQGARIKELQTEAEAKGRIMQKIDTLEKDLSAIGEKLTLYESRVNCHDGELVKLDANIESLRDIIEKMDKKMDRMLERDYPKDLR